MKRILLAVLGILALIGLGPPAAAACPRASAAVIDDVAFRYLPPGLGKPSNFVYDFERVDFVARVWESRIPQGWRVDLDLVVMRGARLSSPRALHRWFIAYDVRDPAPVYRPVRVRGHPGWLAKDEVFWLIRPGLAVSATVDGARWTRHEARRIAQRADGSARHQPVRRSPRCGPTPRLRAAA
jgi:hypothetical protein